jgi:drug/metabolite transporter (DMT)-like permease
VNAPLFALLTAAGWGSADFLAGLSTRRVGVLWTLLAVQVVGFGFAVLALAVSNETAPVIEAIAWSTLGGLSGLVGVGLLFLALSRDTMSLVAPLAALVAASVPALVGVANGDRLGVPGLAGLVVAIGAVALVSIPDAQAHEGHPGPPRASHVTWSLIVLSGLGSAGFFLSIDQAHIAGGGTVWTAVVVRVTSLVAVVAAFGVLALRGSERRPAPSRGILPFGLGAGLLDSAGTLSYVIASGMGVLSTSAVLASLAPVATIIWARAVLDERLSRLRFTGVLLALLGVVLINVGGSPP